MRGASMRGAQPFPDPALKGNPMNSIIDIVGLVVVVIAVESFLGLR